MFDRLEKRNMSAKVRAYGKARLDVARRVREGGDWNALWKKGQYDFPFQWGQNWKQCVEYRVDDFAAEVGFYTDVLGLPVNAFDVNYAMFTSPDQAFFLAVVPTQEGEPATPFDAVRFQFMVSDLFPLTEELEKRGVVFEQYPQAVAEGSELFIGSFRTPHGILIELWGIVDIAAQVQPEETGESEAEAEPQSPVVEEQPEAEPEPPVATKPVAISLPKKIEPVVTPLKELEYQPDEQAETDEDEPHYVSDEGDEPELHYRPITLKK